MYILEAGKLTATVIKKKCEGWFQFSANTLPPLIKERNELLHTIRSSSHQLPEAAIINMKSNLQLQHRRIKATVSLAKANWYGHLCSNIHKMSMNPRLAWDNIRLPTNGKSAHHPTTTNMSMRMSEDPPQKSKECEGEYVSIQTALSRSPQ